MKCTNIHNFYLLWIIIVFTALLYFLDSSHITKVEKEPEPVSSQIALTFSRDERIRSAFERLSATVINMIEHFKFSKLQHACIHKAMSPDSFMSKSVVPKVEETSTFENLCNVLTKAHYWNYLDTRMMEAMVTASMIPAAKKSLENYKKTFFNMKLSEVVPSFVPVIQLKPNNSTIEEILDKDPRQFTIGELHEHRFYLETELFETGTDTLTYYKINVGSIIIVWQIHADYAYQAYLSLQKKISKLSSQKIKHLSIPDVNKWTGLPVVFRGQDLREIGPIDPSLHHVQQDPHSLPENLRWAILNSDNITEVSRAFDHYDQVNLGICERLQWFVSHPCFNKNLLFGIRESSQNELIWAVYCTPLHVRIGRKILPIIELHYSGKLNQYDKSGQNHLHKTAMKEIMRKINLAGISQAIIQGGPTTMVIRTQTHLTSWIHLALDYISFDSPRTGGLRRMTSRDVSETLTFINQYMSRFEFGQVFLTENEITHCFLCPSMPNYIITFVVEDPETATITDLFAFRLMAGSKTALAFAIIDTKSPPKQFISDLLICAKQHGADSVYTYQFGLEREAFTDNLFYQADEFYWHFYNYIYPEVEEEKFCLFCY